MQELFYLLLLLWPALAVGDVGVNDDYYLNYPVSFSCPLPQPYNTTIKTDDSTDDDYYGSALPADYPGFVFFYIWMSLMTVGPLLYFAYNNKIAPIGLVKPFVPEVQQQSYNHKESNNHNCSQTGLTQSPLGLLLYVSVILTIIGLQLILLLLVMCYYFFLYKDDIQRDTPGFYTGWSPFDDAENALYVFIIAWAVAFVWVAFFKRPQSLYCSFLRRSELSEVTYVAVFIPDSRGVEVLAKDSDNWLVSKIFKSVAEDFDSAMAFLFSEPEHTEPGQTTYCPVQIDRNGVRFFEFQMRRYNFDSSLSLFSPAELYIGGTAEQLLSLKKGLSTSEVKERLAAIGPNVIATEEPSFFKILIQEFSRIFYVYQNFMTWTWINYSYWHMGIVNTLVYTLGGTTVSVVNYRNAVRLRELCRVEGSVEVFRNGQFKSVDQARLVPGDIIALQAGMVYCDMVVLSGETVVDESSLTGESMPVVKTAIDPIDPAPYDPVSHHKHHTVFAGTTIINQQEMQRSESIKDVKDTTEEVVEGSRSGKGLSSPSSKGANLALVVRTGSYTMKGEMLREMFFGKPKKFKFDLEVNIVLLILLAYAIFAFSITLYFLNDQAVFGFFYAVYVVASALPPLLPTVFIVSEGIAADRLLQKRVAVTDPHRILMAGKVRVAFFDKTGTLTEQGLDFHSTVTVEPGGNGKLAIFREEEEASPHSEIARGMAVCHSLKKLAKEGSDEMVLLGNAIDRKMFEAVSEQFDLIPGRGMTPDLIISKGGPDVSRYAIVKQFDFDNKRKTQSVIIREEGNKDSSNHGSRRHFIYIKGTGEALKAICKPHSIPGDFDEAVANSARQGIYQISIGYREIATTNSSELSSLLSQTRNEIESDLTFLGFINFTNPMKPQTPDVIRQLREGDIRTVMISGDHILTALYMARLSGMIHEQSRVLLGNEISEAGEITFVEESSNQPFTEMTNSQLLQHLATQRYPACNIELALLGSVWDKLWEVNKKKATRMAHFLRVIGRCSPHTKITVVDCLNREGFITMMCGDGGNDCGALKTAHVGVALSDAEASVVAPFTSLDKTITSVVEVIKEGRCTLSSAFSSYKYMILYGQIETINQMISAWFSITFSEWCWVFMDGFWVITMAFSLPFADVADTIAPSRPTSSILGPHTLLSSIGCLVINFLFVVIALGALWGADFFQCRHWKAGSIADVTSLGDNYESSVLFLVSGYQYITTAMAYNFGFEYRAAWWKNWRFLFFVTCWTVIHFTVILAPSSLSCFFRVNCENWNVVRFATSTELVPIQNDWNHTLMPGSFRGGILAIVIMNGVALCLWEYFVVNGPGKAWAKQRFPKVDRLLGGVGYQGVTSTAVMEADCDHVKSMKKSHKSQQKKRVKSTKGDRPSEITATPLSTFASHRTVYNALNDEVEVEV